jgi:hypothetical protein
MLAGELRSVLRIAKLQKVMRTFGIILLVSGIIMTVFTGFTLITRDEVVDLGVVEIRKEKQTPVYWSPAAGVVLIATGVIVLWTGGRRRLR